MIKATDCNRVEDGPARLDLRAVARMLELLFSVVAKRARLGRGRMGMAKSRGGGPRTAKARKARNVARPFTPEALLKRSIRSHFTRLGFTKANDGTLVLPGAGKEIIRQLHGAQRAERLQVSSDFVERTSAIVLPHFANGDEIDPAKIQLKLIRVESGTEQSELFRFATLTWSVPVSLGFGRRLRYLVWDEAHNRLVGVMALGDPVFNLSVRDNLIEWDVHDRAKRLVNILDAYVLGAVPPYNMLLGGKAVACLIRSREVFDDFKQFYGNTVGIISGKRKHAELLAVTTTSSMGRSSVYNRLQLAGVQYMTSIGYTVGWGHFHIPDHLFEQIRHYLHTKKDPYAGNHQFGDGPNWRFRSIRKAFGELNINESVLRHGIQREVFLCTFGANALEILKTGKGKLNAAGLKTVHEISDLARERWMVPRAVRRPEYRDWTRDGISSLIDGVTLAPSKSRARTT
jgi:hypothetical protein